MRVNDFFQIDKAFFVMDSGSLADVETGFYGYTIRNGSIVTEAAALENAELTGEGAYVCIRRNGNTIRIFQDYIGSYGLYLYREGDYFAISNSFLRLVEYLRRDRLITFNREYAGAFLAADLCAIAYADTMVNEIKVLDRSAVVDIDISTGRMKIDYVDYCENTVRISSPEGMEILDGWFQKWTQLLANIRRETSNIQVDLSGGFDTRMTFSLLLGSCIDPGGIHVYSADDDLHTHREDFEIASRIAEHYDFALNNNEALSKNKIPNTMEDIVNISFYTKLCFHKQMYYSRWHHPTAFYFVTGAGGECVRDYWNMSQEAFVENALRRCGRFPGSIAGELADATRGNLERTFRQIREKYTRLGRGIDEADLMLYVYRETRCRNHFGKDTVENYLRGSYKLSPLLDPQLHRLRLSDDVCQDRNLLMAVILARYAPDLLKFSFDGNRGLAARTVVYARKLSAAYPSAPEYKRDSRLNPVTPAVHGGLEESIIPLERVREYVDWLFRLPEIADCFTELYGEKAFSFVCQDMEKRNYFALQNAYAIMGISKTIRDTRCSRDLTGVSFGHVLQQQSLASGERDADMDVLERYPWLENYITARVDIKNGLESGNDVEILKISDGDARITRPKWMAANGNGCVIEGQKGMLEVEFRCAGAGTLTVALRSRDVRDSQKNRIPFWLDFDQVRLNGEDYVENSRPVWHDAPLKITRQVKDGEVMCLQLRWIPRDPCK